MCTACIQKRAIVDTGREESLSLLVAYLLAQQIKGETDTFPLLNLLLNISLKRWIYLNSFYTGNRVKSGRSRAWHHCIFGKTDTHFRIPLFSQQYFKIGQTQSLNILKNRRTKFGRPPKITVFWPAICDHVPPWRTADKCTCSPSFGTQTLCAAGFKILRNHVMSFYLLVLPDVQQINKSLYLA